MDDAATTSSFPPGSADGFSEDLVQQAFRHLILLHAVDTWPNGGLYTGPNVTKAIARYRAIFMPIYASAAPEVRSTLRPPLDVAWIWLVHRLSPKQYLHDCHKNYGRRLDPDPAVALDFVTEAPSIWNEHATSKYYPPDTGLPRVPPHLQPFKTDYDLYAAVARQSTFLLQLLRACYTDPWYLQQAVKRYHRLLLLKKNNPDLFVVPMNDIDLIWHTHQSLPSVYNVDCKRILGSLLDPHEEAARARSQGVSLQDSFELTKKAWASMYPDSPYEVPGSCYIPPKTVHPAVLAMGKEVEMYDPAAGAAGCTPPWRAGAHALYLQWLVAKGYEQAVFSCCTRPRQFGPAAWKAMRSKAQYFKDFKQLPHDSTHPYWSSLLRSASLRRDSPNVASLLKARAVQGVPIADDDSTGASANAIPAIKAAGPDHIAVKLLSAADLSQPTKSGLPGTDAAPPAPYYEGVQQGWMVAGGLQWVEAFDAVADLAAAGGGPALLEDAFTYAAKRQAAGWNARPSGTQA